MVGPGGGRGSLVLVESEEEHWYVRCEVVMVVVMVVGGVRWGDTEEMTLKTRGSLRKTVFMRYKHQTVNTPADKHTGNGRQFVNIRPRGLLLH